MNAYLSAAFWIIFTFIMIVIVGMLSGNVTLAVLGAIVTVALAPIINRL